jgi:hypothetical protein
MNKARRSAATVRDAVASRTRHADTAHRGTPDTTDTADITAPDTEPTQPGGPIRVCNENGVSGGFHQ